MAARRPTESEHQKDNQIAAEIKNTIVRLAALMTEAKTRNIIVSFGINEVDIMGQGGIEVARKEFRDITTIQKIETLVQI